MKKKEFERRTGWTLTVVDLNPLSGSRGYILTADAPDGRRVTKSYAIRLSEAIRLFSEKILSEEIAIEVFKRQGWRCNHCGEMRPLQIHHLVHRSQRGTHRLENLVALCAECHEKEHRNGTKEDRKNH